MQTKPGLQCAAIVPLGNLYCVQLGEGVGARGQFGLVVS